MSKKYSSILFVVLGAIAVILAVVFFATEPYVYRYSFHNADGSITSGGATISDFMNFVKNAFGALFLIIGLGFIGIGLKEPAGKENK